MRHIPLHLSTVVVASLMMAVMVLAGGHAVQESSQPLVPGSPVVESLVDEASTCLEAPVTGHTAPGIDGVAVLCRSGRDVRVRMRVDGVTPGKVYTAWLSYIARPELCRDLPCSPSDFSGDAPVGPMAQIAGGVATPSQRLELEGELRDLELASGAQVTLLLRRPRGAADLHSQAVFFIPS